MCPLKTRAPVVVVAGDGVAERDAPGEALAAEHLEGAGHKPALRVGADGVVLEQDEAPQLEARRDLAGEDPERGEVHRDAEDRDADEEVAVVEPEAAPRGHVRSGVVVLLHEGRGFAVAREQSDLEAAGVDRRAREHVGAAPVAPALRDGGDHALTPRRTPRRERSARMQWRQPCREGRVGAASAYVRTRRPHSVSAGIPGAPRRTIQCHRSSVQARCIGRGGIISGTRSARNGGARRRPRSSWDRRPRTCT